MNAETVIKMMLSRNRVFEIRGASGAGKTTFLKAVAVVSYRLQIPIVYVGIKEIPSNRVLFEWRWIKDRLEEIVDLTTSGFKPGLSMFASKAREFNSLADYMKFLESPKEYGQREVAMWLIERVQRLPIVHSTVRWPQYVSLRVSGIDGVLVFGALFVSLPHIEQMLRIKPVLLLDDLSPLMAMGNRTAFEAVINTIRSFANTVFIVLHDYSRTPEELMRPTILAPASGAGEMIHKLVRRNKYVILDNSVRYEVKFEEVAKLAKRFEEIRFEDVVTTDEGVPPTGAQQIYKAVLCIT